MSGDRHQYSPEQNKCSQYGQSLENHYFVSGCASQRSPLVELSEGQTLLNGRFMIEKRLGSGSISTVYLAADAVRREKVALKIVDIGPLGNSDIEAQIKKEVQLQTKINDHHHVVKVFDIHLAAYGASGLLLLSMEYADGGTFRQWILDNAADILVRQTEGVSLLKQACRGVTSLHEAGIVHLDLKPENLLFVDGILKVSDLGISKFWHHMQLTHETCSGGQEFPLGTYAYMSPEQFESPHPDDVDYRSDIYSLGVILFELCHRRCRPPFGGSYEQLRLRHLQMEPPPLEGTPENEKRVVRQALQKNPANRYGSVDDFVADMEGTLTLHSQPSLEEVDPQPESDTSQIEQLWQQVTECIRSEHFEQAQHFCHKILEITPTHDHARQMLDEINNRYQQAKQFYRTIDREMDSKSLDYLAELLKEAVNLYPDHSDGRLVQIRLGSMARQFKEATAEGIRAIAQGSWEAALGSFEKASQIDSGATVVMRVIEFVKAVRQQIEVARGDIDRAIQQHKWRKALIIARNVDRYVAQIKAMAE